MEEINNWKSSIEVLIYCVKKLLKWIILLLMIRHSEYLIPNIILIIIS
jgi:hypothetical protein